MRWWFCTSWMSGSSGSQISIARWNSSVTFGLLFGSVTYISSVILSNASFFQRGKIHQVRTGNRDASIAGEDIGVLRPEHVGAHSREHRLLDLLLGWPDIS